MTQPLRILVVDDHPIVFSGVDHALKAFATPAVCDHVNSVELALNHLDEGAEYDLIITDLYLPNLTGFDLISAVSTQTTPIPILVLSGTEQGADLVKATRLGALGVISKSADAEELAGAISLASRGEVVNSEWLMEKMNAIEPQASEVVALSKRQHDCLELIEKGLTNKQIADQLCVSESTVKYHIKTLFLAVQANTRTACVSNARKFGLLS